MDIEQTQRHLGEMSPHEIADELERLDREERALAFRLLPRDRALEVFEDLDAPLQQELLEALRDESVRRLFEEMDPDDRARLLDELPAKVAKRLVAGLSPHERALTSVLLGYPEESAGRIMSPEYVNLRASMTVEEALAKVRRAGQEAETVYALPVTDDQRRLVGVVGLRALVLASPQMHVSALMTPKEEVVFGRVTDDQEDAARLVGDASLIALPVVDSEDRLVGIITFDDAMAVLERESTEDVARAGASQPLDRPYLASSLFQVARSRAMWLLLLGVAATLTVNVLQYFEDTLDEVVTLALFIPLLMGTGGNTGAQSVTTIVRAMALGEVRFGDVLRVIWREARVGILLGAILGVLAFLPVSIFFDGDLALVISLTLISVCTLAATAGSLLPMLAKRVGVDPAVVSAPLITTFVDATGLVIYFLIAKAILDL
ncbi:MAG TPA: magnesium transporter [Actinomycetota bacterium]|nr:magnesium transporter [Actinomycetota bacterium]